MNFGSTLLSIFLHGAVFALLWLWPSSPPVELNKPVIQISLTMGAPGGDKLPSPVLGHQGGGRTEKPSASAAPDKPAGAKQLAQSLPDPTRKEHPEAKAETKPEAKKEAEPERQKEVKPQPEKAPKPAPAKQAEENTKPAALSNQPKPKDSQKSKTDDSKNGDKTPPKNTSKNGKGKEAGSDDVLKAALADARAKAGPENRSGGSTKGGGGSVARALAQAAKDSKGGGIGGGGGEGDGPGGGGLYDVYAGMVILAVRPNWSMPTYSRTQLVAHVRVKLDPNGKVLNATLEHGSGRADFDASAVNAVLRTKDLPKPPTPEQQDIVIAFNSLEMMGR